MRTNYNFNDYKKSFPFLQEIPHDVASRLSVDEFYFPDVIVEKARKELEEILGNYVMTYKGNVFNRNISLKSHLCANYKGAFLSEEQVSLLSFYETKIRQRNARFVVYQKPLQRISIEESPFFY